MPVNAVGSPEWHSKILEDRKQYLNQGKARVSPWKEAKARLLELKGWTQGKLANYCSINAKNISVLENDRLEIGKKRTVQLATAFDVHPAIIMFTEYSEI